MARFDPRGRTNHALLVTVPEYTSDLPPDPSGVLGDIAAVRHNGTELERVLRAGGVFREEDITTSSPAGSDRFFRDLMRARDRADGLLLVYFAGHGLVSSYNEPDELWLAMPRTTIVPGNPPVFLQAVRWSEVLSALCQATAEQVVVVLDCCYAGNASAAWNRLPTDHRERISLLACVQANDRIDAGDATTPTPFTAQLVRALDEGVADGGEVSFSSLADALRSYMSKNHTTLRKKPTPWVPQSCPADGTDVVLAAVPRHDVEEVPPDTPPPPPVDPPKPDGRWRRIPVLALAVLALTLAVLLGFAVFRAPSGSACTPPLELRLLTDADAEPTVRKAVNAYLESADNREGDCRRSGITVYRAKAADAVAAFRNSSHFWQDPDPETNPQRDVGPQPDIWIPGSADAVDRARSYGGGGSSVKLRADKPFVHSPMVLAVPAHLAEGSEKDRSGRPLAQFVEALSARADGAAVARTDPEHTDSGLLATVGLYGNRHGAATGAERGLAPGRPLPDGRALLCELPKSAAVDTKTAALVPEHLLKTGVGCGRQTRTPRVAEYPADVPRLTLPFVQVVWDGADRDKDARDGAVERFRDWLTGSDGVAVFTADGYRAGPGDTPPPASPSVSPPATGALADPGRLPDAGEAKTMNAALEAYRKANGPGRVLFLLDNSGSMKDVWDGPGGAPGIIRQSLGGLGGQDEYGVWTVSSSPGATRPYTPLLAVGTHRNRDEARKTVGGARVEGNEADPLRALRAASTAMETEGEGDDSRPRLIVYVTDDEDNTRITPADLEGMLAALRQGGVPVVMASLSVGGCAKGRMDERIATASGGRCLDSSGDLIAGLRDEVARTGTGEGT
ncbi:substrate-binding domain-containing protein [Streptomyces sp. NPDC059875]|uniref:substrate-binding domain-containing protein n=1 Tax=unclassified Streptomyces TaxID=2593676 RepID=UPI00366113A3